MTEINEISLFCLQSFYLKQCSVFLNNKQNELSSPKFPTKQNISFDESNMAVGRVLLIFIIFFHSKCGLIAYGVFYGFKIKYD